MNTWNEIRELYAQGGITQSQLAEKFGVPLGSLRRRAAAEGWTVMRAERSRGSLENDITARQTRMARQLAITDKMLDIISTAMENPDEFYYHIEFGKTSGGSEFVIQRLDALNDERIGRLVKSVGEIFELQRIALGIHDYRDEVAARKVDQDGEIAGRKLELEMIKLENAGGCEEEDTADGFLEALGISGGGGDSDRSA